MGISAVGQITIVDFNDAPSLTGYIEADKNSSVKYNADTQVYNPNFASVNATLSPHVFVSGASGGTDLFNPLSANIVSVAWTRKANTNSVAVALGSGEAMNASTKKLIISSNPFSASIYSVTYFCTVVYRDPVSQLESTCVMQFNFSAVTEGSGTTYAEIQSANGYAFKNDAPASITLSAKLFRGGEIDSTNLTYLWEKYNGTSWVSTGLGTAATQAITPSMVEAMLLVRVTVSDSVSLDSFSSDPCSIIDYTDPLMVQIESSTGTVFKNGTGSATLTAKVYQNGALLSSGVTYSWTKLLADGTADSDWTVKTTQSITVSSTDVETKAIFVCTASKA